MFVYKGCEIIENTCECRQEQSCIDPFPFLTIEDCELELIRSATSANAQGTRTGAFPARLIRKSSLASGAMTVAVPSQTVAFASPVQYLYSAAIKVKRSCFRKAMESREPAAILRNALVSQI